MAADCVMKILAELSGLGKTQVFDEKFSVNTAPDAATYNYRTQVTTNVAEALDLGDVATEVLLVIKAVTNDLDVDLDFVAAFDADFNLEDGEVAVIPNPAGIVYVKNGTADEVCVFEYLLVGNT